VAYLVRFSLAATLVFAIGCGGSQTDATGPEEPDEPEAEDLVFNEYAPIDVSGIVHQPEGLESVPDVNLRGPRQAAWRQARNAYSQGDLAAAAEAYASLLEEFGDDEVPQPITTWAAFVHLRAHQNAEAAALTAELDPADEALRGHEAYVAAWAAFRQGDFERARDFIVVAAKKWPSREGQRAVVNDIVMMTARAGTPLAQADELISDITGGNVQQRYVLLFRLHEQFVFAGHYDLASETLGYIRDVVLEGQALPHEDAVGFGYRRSDYEFRMNRPDQAAALAIEAHQGLEACGEGCAGDTAEAVTQRLSDLGRVFHTVFATSLDEAFYAPATSLYEAYISVPGRADTETVRGYLSNLQQTKENAHPAQGKHDAQVMSNVVIARREAVQACYEQALGWDPSLAGQLTLTMKIDPSGAVTEVTSEPAAGEEGLGLVATCAAERISAWTFPGRTLPGVTSLVYPFTLSTGDGGASDAADGPGEASAPAAESTTAEG
jgi:tetratricopeptide (TPR) repeat protein